MYEERQKTSQQAGDTVTDISSAYAMSGWQTYACALHTMPTRLDP